MTTTTKQPLDLDGIRRRAEPYVKEWRERVDRSPGCPVHKMGAEWLAIDVLALLDALNGALDSYVHWFEAASNLEQQRDRLAAENVKLKAVADAARYTVLAMEWVDTDLNRALAALDTTGGEE